MTKYLLLLTILSSKAMPAVENGVNNFEAELRMLEKGEEKALLQAEQITQKELMNENEIISDSVSTTNAAIQKDENQLNQFGPILKPGPVKVRRIRSR